MKYFKLYRWDLIR
jgi:hypothetical protein